MRTHLLRCQRPQKMCKMAMQSRSDNLGLSELGLVWSKGQSMHDKELGIATIHCNLRECRRASLQMPACNCPCWLVRR